MDDLIIIIPTHKRHEYLPGKIRYYSAFPYQVYICDSTPVEFKVDTGYPSNIHYIWCPDKGFYQKVLHVLENTEAKLYNLTPDDDFLDLNTIKKCCKIMNTNPGISLSVGKQVMFNKPYDGRFFSRKSANQMQGLLLNENRIRNASLVGGHYQNVLWSMYRNDVIRSAFKKLTLINPENGNFIELTLVMEACVRGVIEISKAPLNYREHSDEEHWGKQVDCISAATLISNLRMKQDHDALMATYKDDDRKVADAFMDSYLKKESRWSIVHIVKAIKRRMITNHEIVEEKIPNLVEQILLA
jgi:glycosyltransferase domain-containing protein